MNWGLKKVETDSMTRGCCPITSMTSSNAIQMGKNYTNTERMSGGAQTYSWSNVHLRSGIRHTSIVYWVCATKYSICLCLTLLRPIFWEQLNSLSNWSVNNPILKERGKAFFFSLRKKGKRENSRLQITRNKWVKTHQVAQRENIPYQHAKQVHCGL